MNNNRYDCGRFCRSRFLHMLVIVPLLLAALFAYQAGNSFELTAGTNRINAAANVSSAMIDRQNINNNFLLPETAPVHPFVREILMIYLLTRSLAAAMRTTVPQRMRDLHMAPIKFTSQFVG
ncbi:hypothetical protein [Paenibacillus sp. sgz302251]|uniref:hypothetical protein n=1 Tax=Paenibacillus sp. sgz302251 TaxID=3414493 RepID=UPI003C7D5610